MFIGKLVVAFMNLMSWSKLVGRGEAIGKADSVLRRAEGPRGCGIYGTSLSVVCPTSNSWGLMGDRSGKTSVQSPYIFLTNTPYSPCRAQRVTGRYGYP